FRKLDPLGLAPRKRRCRLSQLYVAESHIHQSLKLGLDLRYVLEQRQSFLNRSVQQIGDRTTLVFHRQSLAVVSSASTDIAQDVDVREKIHLDALQPVALTRLATTALHVERESSRFVAPFARLGGHRIQLADRSEHSGVRSRIRSRSSSDRR